MNTPSAATGFNLVIQQNCRNCLCEADVNLINCIKIFDTGAENIYLVDEQGHYSGAALTRRSFMGVWESGEFRAEPLKAIDISLLSADKDYVLTVVREVFGEYGGSIVELPILSDNVPVMRIAFAKEPLPEYEWKSLFGVIQQLFSRYKKIYFSSLEDQNLRNLYLLGLGYPLQEDNVRKALSPENLLVYAEDVYPAGSKISVTEFYRQSVSEGINEVASRIVFTDDFARIAERDVYDKSSLLIKKFDEGYRSVVVERADGSALGIAALSTFHNYFPAKYFPVWSNLFLPYVEDEEEQRMVAAAAFFGTARREMPIVRDGKVVKLAVLNDFTFRNMSARELAEMKDIDWSLIKFSTAEQFFAAGRTRILLSSLTGEIGEFYERFKGKLDLTVYDERLLEQYLAGEFDFLVYGVDFWKNAPIQKCDAVRLYDLLLAAQMREIGRMHGVL